MSGQPVNSGIPVDRRTLAAKAASSIISTVGSQAIQTLVGFANAAILPLWLGPPEYGVFGMASTVVGFVAIFGDIGLGSALIRHPTCDPVEETTGFALALLSGFLLAAIAALSAPAIGIYFRNRQAGVMAAVMSVNFLVLALSRVSVAKLNRSLEFRKLSSFGILGSVASMTAGIVAARCGAGAWSLAIAFLSAPLVLTVVYLRSAPPRLIQYGYSTHVARELGGFGVQLSGFTFAVSVASLPATLLLGRVGNAAAVGIFALGTKLVVLPVQKIAAAFGAVFLPSFSRIEPESRNRAYLVATRTLLLTTAPVAVGFFVIADELVAILPVRWHGLAPALRYFALGALVEPMGALPLARLIAEGRGRLLFLMGLLAVPVSWISYGIAAQIGSANAFVCAWSCIYTVLPLIYLIVVAGNVANFIMAMKALLPPIVAAVVMGVTVRVIQFAAHVRGTRDGLMIGVASGSITYVLLCYGLMPGEVRRIRHALASLTSRRVV